MRFSKQLFIHIAATAVVFSAILGGSGAWAQTNALNVDPTGSTTATFNPYTVGWTFTLSGTTTVTSLGYYDVDSDGLIDSHQVGIWDSLGNLVTSTEVASGTGTTLSGGFRFQSITDTVLGAGNYTIGAFTSSGPSDSTADDAYLTFAAAPTMAAGITYTGGVYIGPNSTFQRPTTPSDRETAYFGPNFQVASGPPLPEPTSITLAAMGLVGTVIARRRKRA